MDEEEQNQLNTPINILNINNQNIKLNNNNNLDTINTNRKSLSYISPRDNTMIINSHRSNIESNLTTNLRISNYNNLLSERTSFLEIKDNNQNEDNVYDTYRDSQRSNVSQKKNINS
jgi:hypothetical protein